MTQNRIKIAIEFMKDKKSFLVDDLRLGVNDMDVIEVTGWSKLTNFSNVTKHHALEELNEIKLLFLKMISFSKELKDFISNKDIKFSLWFDAAGKGSIGICSEENDVIHWDASLKN